MATDTVGEEFITIVPVGESRPPEQDPAFVTVLAVGAASGAAEVVVRRPRGARLGLGLKFEGGSAAAEKVRRLLVQSCAEDSPAANAIAPWGKLIPGDEILAIDGVSVSELTRIDCVRRLKDSDETLTLLVRHFGSEEKTEIKDMDSPESVPTAKPSEIIRPTMLPPPVPPRKLGKKNSFKDKATLQTVGEQNSIEGHQTLNGKENGVSSPHNGIAMTKLSRKSSFDSHIHRQNKEGIAYLKKGSPEEVRRLVRRLSDGKSMPPEAEIYIDLLSNEWERCLLLADAESDDTGSSISTVVDRLGSMASSVENSIPSTPIMQPKTIDIQKVLNCIENIDSNILKDITSNKFLDTQADVTLESKVEKKVMPNGYRQENGNSTENTPPSKKDTQQNDKNNNSVQITATEINKVTPPDKSENKQATVLEKPKPMPRSMKVERSLSERKPRPIPIPETPPPPVPEPLLTPTKKNCIETWLQRSEAEMNKKTIEKLEEPPVPEALPRLIDFVPKPQFKEESSPSTLVRPTGPPPPPPAETREDGSGASLDTIGELDESCDGIDSVKPVGSVNETVDRKATLESSFWEDRHNKSDAEDKSLSNDEIPLPSCPRQPPDGVETPSDAVEKIPDLPSKLPPRLPVGWPNTRTRFAYTSRTQDARSEASVKDKIAMFSNDRSTSTECLDKCGTLPTRTFVNSRKSAAAYPTNYSEASSLERRLTKSQDNLDELPRSYKRHLDRPEVLGSLESTSSSSTTASLITRPLQECKPLFYGSTTTLTSKVDTPFVQSVYHTRSVSDDTDRKNVHKSNLEYLIEQRKKSMSKLRGLVIPELQGPVEDLPEIKVQNSFAKSFLLTSNQNNNINKEHHKASAPKPSVLSDSKWKTNLLPNNLPKYSPAFKRKSLQVYTPSCLSKESTPERKFNEKVEMLNKINNSSKPLMGSLDLKNVSGRTATLPSKISTISGKYNDKDFKDIMNDYKNVEIKICTATDVVDSDNDSAMSSTQSSYRSSASSPMHTIDTIESDCSRLSPRISHYTTYSLIKSDIPNKTSVANKSCEEYVKRNVCRSVSSDTNVSLSSSAGSAATSGSQASCSSLESSVADSDKRKVSKSYNIDTINRRNILASAKCRSGRDEKLNSPVIETKFSHESFDRSPSPTNKASDRLSTLTTSVSAVSNKGDSRRRSKVIAESDSDSDGEVNVRQRKTDFKNSRLKRNSSSAKNKQNEVNSDPPKAEDAPRVISEKIIKEIKKAGLDDFNSIKTSIMSERNHIEVKKIETNIFKDKKEEKTVVKSIKRDTGIPVPKSTSVLEKVLSRDTHSTTNKLSTPETDSISVEVDKIPTHVFRLKRGAGSGVGLILAGGIDCEAKDVTVHRVLADSAAAKAGLKRGAKILSINGIEMAGLTHAQSVTILKEQRSEVVIEVENDVKDNVNGVGCGSEKAESKVRHGVASSGTRDDKGSGSVVTVVLEKAGGGAGLGFGLDGGRDSPQGDRPLTIKKLFAGGAAAQSGCVLVGAELLSAGGQSMEGFTRTQAWAALKALPSGPIALVLRNPRDQVAP